MKILIIIVCVGIALYCGALTGFTSNWCSYWRYLYDCLRKTRTNDTRHLNSGKPKSSRDGYYGNSNSSN